MLEELEQILLEKAQDKELKLPVLPEVAMQVMQMTSDANSDATQLTKLINRDQALASNVLRITNSASFGGKIQIVSLQQAITRLGMSQISEIALAASVQKEIFDIKGYESIIKKMWRKSLACGILSKIIAKQVRHNVESAYLCGLLHSIGKPISLKTLAEQDSDYSKDELADSAKQFHQVLGLRLAEEWKLPKQVQETIKHYKDYQKADTCENDVMICTLAAQLSLHLYADNPPSFEEIIAHPVCNDLNLYPDDLEAIQSQLEKVKEQVSDLS